MVELLSYQAQICLTAGGVLINDHKVLLVKHKKTGWWLNPGGHLEANEVPHQAAEREFWEETGIRVKARSFGYMPSVTTSQYVPVPFSINLHWINEQRYQARINANTASSSAETRTCEQHLNFLYVMEATGSLEYQENSAETEGIGWFTLAEVAQLGTPQEVIGEVTHAFTLTST